MFQGLIARTWCLCVAAAAAAATVHMNTSLSGKNLVRRVYTRDASSRMHIGMLLLLFVDVALGL